MSTLMIIGLVILGLIIAVVIPVLGVRYVRKRLHTQIGPPESQGDYERKCIIRQFRIIDDE